MQVSHLDRPLPHDLAQFRDVVVLLNGCSQVAVVLWLRLRLSTECTLLENTLVRKCCAVGSTQRANNVREYRLV